MVPGGFCSYQSRPCQHFGQNGFIFCEHSFFCFLGAHISGFPGPQISKFPDFQAPDLQIPKFLDLQVSRFPDASGGAGAAAGRTLRSQPDPSPNAPRDQIRRKGPCCDIATKRMRPGPGIVQNPNQWRPKCWQGQDLEKTAPGPI